MTRRLLNLLTMLSLLLLVAVVVLWVRSYWAADGFVGSSTTAEGLSYKQPYVLAMSARGGVLLVTQRSWGRYKDRGDLDYLVAVYSGTDGFTWGRIGDSHDRAAFLNSSGYEPVAGFLLRRTMRREGGKADGHRSATVLNIPHWFLALVVSVPAASRLVAWRARRRRRPGHCPSCSYDVRATPERCPECGTPAAVTPA